MVETDWTSRLISLLLGIIGALETPARQTLNLALSHTRSAAMRKCAACLWGRRDVVGISHTNTALTECTCVHAYVIVYNYVFIFYEYYIYTYISQYLYQTFLDLLNKLCSAYKSKRGHQDQRNDQLLEWCCQQVRGLLCHTSCSYIVTYVHSQCNTTWHR